MNIEINGYSFTFKKDKYELESDRIFTERCWFIAYFYEKWMEEHDDYQKLIKFSKLWSNIKFKNCEYSLSIMDKIKYLTNGTIYEL